MPEIYEDVKEFGKTLAEIFKPYYYGFREEHENDKDRYSFEYPSSDISFDITILGRDPYTHISRLHIIVKKKSNVIGEYTYNIKEAIVNVYIGVKVKYVNKDISVSVSGGSMTIPALNLLIVTNKRIPDVTLIFTY